MQTEENLSISFQLLSSNRIHVVQRLSLWTLKISFFLEIVEAHFPIDALREMFGKFCLMVGNETITTCRNSFDSILVLIWMMDSSRERPCKCASVSKTADKRKKMQCPACLEFLKGKLQTAEAHAVTSLWPTYQINGRWPCHNGYQLDGALKSHSLSRSTFTTCSPISLILKW